MVKKVKKKKGFSMVEVLAIIVILAILTSIAIPIISHYLENGKDTYNKKMEKQLLLAGKNYYSANQNLLPKLNYIDKKFEGETKDEVQATELLSKNFLKNDLVDADGYNCNESYVIVAKNSFEKEHIWHSCLICETDEGLKVRTEGDPYCALDVNWNDKEAPTCKIEVQTTDEYKNDKNIYNPKNISLKFTELSDMPTSEDVNRKNYSYLSIYNETTGKTIYKDISKLGETQIKEEIDLIKYIGDVEGKLSVSIIDKGFNKSNACISDLILDNTPPTCEIKQGKIVKIDSGLEKTDLEIVGKDKNGIDENSYAWEDDTEAPNPRTVYINDTYKGTVKDVAGNESDPCEKKLTDLDTKAATVDITATKKTSKKEVKTNTWSDEGLNYTFKRTDDLKMDATITYCQDLENKCNPKTSTLIATENTEITSYNTLTGEYFIRYVASIEIEGKQIYSNVKSYKAKVDTVKPEVTIKATKKLTGTAVTSGKWSTEGLNFTLTKKTSGISGYKIYYCKDTENKCTPNQIATSGKLIQDFNKTEGIFYIRYKIESKAGKSSSVGSYTAKVDTIKPTVTIKATKKSAGTAVTSGKWSTEGLNFVLTKKTSGASGYTIYYCQDTKNTCTPKTTISSGTKITKFNTTEGTFYIRYKIVSTAGKSSSVGSYTAKVDTVKPTVTISAKKKTAGTAVTSGKWSTEGLNFTLTKGQSGKSGYTIYYCKDTKNTCTPKTTISSGTKITDYNKTEGIFYIRYKIVSTAGKSSSVGSYTAKVDTVKPTVTIAAKKKTAGTAVTSGKWSTEGLNFILTNGTVGSSGATIYYCKDTKNTCTPGTTTSSGTKITKFNTTEGTFYIRYKIVSTAGLSSSVGSYTAKVDTVKPTVTISAKKKTAGTAVSSGTWSNQGLNFTLTKGTVGSSGYTIYYCKDTANSCSPTTTISSGTKITKYNTLTGTFYIRYKIVSTAGKSSSFGSFKARVDTTKPKITYDVNKSIVNSAWYKTSSDSPFKITIKCTDGGSGVNSFKINGTSYSDNPKTLSRTSSARPKEYKTVCVDKAGNSSDKTEDYYIRVYGKDSSCGCDTYKRCKAAGCEKYNSCRASVCGCDYYKRCKAAGCASYTTKNTYGWSATQKKHWLQGSVTNTTTKTTCNSSIVGKNRITKKECSYYGKNQVSCEGYTYYYKTCKKTGSTKVCDYYKRGTSCGCEQYNSCRNSSCTCDYYKRSSACNCETYKSCWHYD